MTVEIVGLAGILIGCVVTHLCHIGERALTAHLTKLDVLRTVAESLKR